MTLTAEEVFEKVTDTLPECEQTKSSDPASSLLESLGGVAVERQSATSRVLVNCVFTDFLGNSVTVSEKWHDPSGPYQNFPDIHRVRVTLQVFGKPPVERMAEYEQSP